MDERDAWLRINIDGYIQCGVQVLRSSDMDSKVRMYSDLPPVLQPPRITASIHNGRATPLVLWPRSRLSGLLL